MPGNKARQNFEGLLSTCYRTDFPYWVYRGLSLWYEALTYEHLTGVPCVAHNGATDRGGPDDPHSI
jgi:hypothetical protein